MFSKTAPPQTRYNLGGDHFLHGCDTVLCVGAGSQVHLIEHYYFYTHPVQQSFVSVQLEIVARY